ncbi:MAG: hypothetical protein RL722_573 [Pseudomonadota bacterium]|jgi:hypothetical protein
MTMMKHASLPAAILLLAGASLAHADARDDEIKALRERVEALELKQKDAVVAGDIGGSTRQPGSETSVRIYGHAEVHAIKDIGLSSPDDLFTDLSFQPTTAAGGPKGKLRMTAESSRIGFETATPTKYGSLTTKVEADFYSYGAGNRNRLRLRHAYGEYAGILIGQTWSTFMDLDDLPETVDFNGPIGAPFSRRTMIRYTYNDPQFAKFTVALEDPADQFGGGSNNEKLPQLVLRFDKGFDRGAVNARYLSHQKRSDSETKRGNGFGVGGSYKLTDKDLLMGQFTAVDGDIDQLYGSNGYAIDGSGAITFDKNRGLVLGWAHAYNDQLRANVVYGANKGKTAEAIDNKKLAQFHIGAIYSPIRNVELGAEYIYGKSTKFSGDTGKMQRVDLMARYSF